MKNSFLAKQKFKTGDELIVIFEDPHHHGVYRSNDGSGNWDKVGYKIVKFVKKITNVIPEDLIEVSLNNQIWCLRPWQVLNLSNIKVKKVK